MLKNIFIEIKKLPLKTLIPTEGNPQEMDDKTYKGLVKSMKTKGWLLDPPVLWFRPDKEYQIISGHHRIKAAIDSGILETDCKVLSGITEEMARKLVAEANQRRGKPDPLKLEKYIQDILGDYKDINLDVLNEEIGIPINDIFKDVEEDLDLQKESESLKLTITFKSFEEKELFVEILDYYGNRGRSISEKIKQFVGIFLRDLKKKDEKNSENDINNDSTDQKNFTE